MMIVALNLGLFALATAGLAILSLAYGDLAPMWGVLPAAAKIPIDLFAVIVLAGCAGLGVKRFRLQSLMAASAYYAVWALLALPAVFANPLGIGAWYGVVEAATMLAGAAILLKPAGPVVRGAQILFGLTCIFYGWSHFLYADYTAAMVPGWLPGPKFLAYATGAAHICAGLAIAVGVLPYLAAFLEMAMMAAFGLLVWVPSFFADPIPQWATPPRNQWSEIAVNLMLVAAAWIVTTSFGKQSEPNSP